MKLPLIDYVEFDVRKEQLEKAVAELNDKIGEQKLKLQRAQRDVTDYSGRLRYGAKGLNSTDVNDLKQKEEASVAAVLQSESTLRTFEDELRSSASDLAEVKRQLEAIMSGLKMKFCVTALNEKPSALTPRKADEDGGGSKQPIAASFAENIHKITDEIKYLFVGGGKYASIKLFVNDAAPINDAAPHFSSWEQRTVTTILNGKEKVTKVQQRLVDCVNAVSSYYPDLSKNTALWTEFVEMVDASFVVALGENIERGLWLYERALTGKACPELFSVNLKLTANCRVALLPTANDLPNLVLGVVQDKIFSIVPSNTISDVINTATASKSGKGLPLKKLQSMKPIASKLDSIKNAVARYGEDLLAAVVKVEDRFQSYWTPEECTKLSLDQLKAARDEVEFEFGYVRQRMYNGAFQLNAFPLQDTLLSLLTSQIDSRRQQEAVMTDEVLQQMIKGSTVLNASTSAVPNGGLAAMLQRANGQQVSKRSKAEEWGDKFDPIKFVEQLVTSQIRNGAAEPLSLPTTSVMQEVRASKASTVANSPGARSSRLSDMENKENVASSASAKGRKTLEPVETPSRRPQDLPFEKDPLPTANSPNSSKPQQLPTLQANSQMPKPTALAPVVSPRPSSTPSTTTQRASLTQSQGPLTLTPNRLGKGNSPQQQQTDTISSLGNNGAIRSAEIPKSTPPLSSAPQESRGAWGSPTKQVVPDLGKDASAKDERKKPRTIDLPPKEPESAPTTAPLFSPYREKQVATPPSQVPRSIDFGGMDDPTKANSGSTLPSIDDTQQQRSTKVRGILKGQQPLETQSSTTGATSAGANRIEDDEDEYTLQRLLQKEQESLERIRQMKERDELRRKEIQAAHRKGAVTDETLKKISPRSEYQQLLEEQARLDNARRDNEIRLREAEKEARRARDEQEQKRQWEMEEEERKQREWEEQLRRQHEENAKRRAREKQAADDAERDALRRKQEEEEKRKQYQKELEERLEDELRRRAMQQQKEREERDLERAKREQEALVQQELERQRQRAAFERLRSSPPPRDNDTPISSNGDACEAIAPAAETSALRRKLSLPPVQGATSDSRPATPPSIPMPTSARSRKPFATASTPRASTNSLPAPLSANSISSQAHPNPSGDSTPREASTPNSAGGGFERSLLDEYKQYCLNFGIKPNSGLLKSLPSVVGDYATTINLDLNYIGVKGVQPLLQILKRNRGLKLLNLKDNNLENNEVRALVSVLLTDSGNALTHLDLSNNPISLAGGSAIMDLVTQKKSLTTVVLRGTLIQPKVVEKIVEAAESNRRRAAWNNGSD